MKPAFPIRPLGLAMALALAGCAMEPVYERPAMPVPLLYPGQAAPQAAAASAAPDTPAIPAVPASGDVAEAIPVADAPAADIAVAQGLTLSGQQANIEPAPPRMGWAELFNDARLRALIDIALENNRDMQIASERVQEAQAQYGIVESDRFPTVGIGANAQATRTGPAMRGPDSSSVSRVFMAGVGLTSFELDFFGRLKSLSDAALQGYLATEQAERTVHINLVAQVAEAYFRQRTATELAVLMEKTLASRQATLDLVQARYDSGVASALDRTQARAQLETVKADLEGIRRMQAQADNALQLLLGTPPPDDLPPAEVFGKQQLASSVPVGLPSELLERRPDILAAEHRLKAANANIGAARAAFFPNISLTGLLGFASPQLGGLFGGGTRYWQYSPQIQVPLFSSGLKGNLALAEARRNIAVLEYEKAIQVAFREVADALAGEASYHGELDALRALQDTSMEAVELARLRYETGVDSFLQVQTAEVNLYGTQTQLIQTGMESLLNRIALFKALGGGWLRETEARLPVAKSG
ncbi:MAG: efflux transporter outer membrane subunit [Castellaniella sp.]